MSATPDAVMVFAAGFGTRMGRLTQTRPKPLIKVGGIPLIDHLLALVHAAQPVPSRIVVNTHYRAKQLECHLARHNILVSREMPDILDTGGGLRKALPLLGPGPVFTANSDALWKGPNPLTLLARSWDAHRMDALLACIPLHRCIGRAAPGDFSLGSDGRLTRNGDHVYGGIQILNTDRLTEVPEVIFSLTRYWDLIAADDRLYGIEYPGTWCDVGWPECIPLARELVRNGNV